MPPLLSVAGLRVGFDTDAGRAQVLDGVNLEIGRGEVVGLVGESGCGKTTLARSILGILPRPPAVIESGRIDLDGTDLLTLPARAMNDAIRGRRITYIPQDPLGSLNPVFRVGTQIMELMKWKSPDGKARRGRWPGLFTPYPHKRRRADRARVLEALRAVQIPDPEAALRKYPHQFSGGQRQRLVIAMALLTEPRLIIADEPTTALDVTIQAQILALLRRLVKERGISVLFTTHDLGTAYELCDRIVVMYAGQEVESAPIDRFFAHPAHPYTRRLLESLPRPDGSVREIPGEIPGLVHPPGGCRFHPRCPNAGSECGEHRPPVDMPEAGHALRCYHPDPMEPPR
ncbi:MAG: peptide ABC transporter ATP-binding protein [Rhodospirillaceae bacterium]|nr:peptide ABC transporter ATP-binding protein [Rhodospirillaceae bacterium]